MFAGMPSAGSFVGRAANRAARVATDAAHWVRGQSSSSGLLVCVLALCTLVLYLRKPDQFENPQFWAEDGFFYHTHFLYGWHTLVEPYNGYLHTIPRLIAGFSWWLDPAMAPSWFVGTALAGTLYVAALALSQRQPLRGRPLMALAIVCVPDAFEVLLNVTNLQWVLAAGLVLLLAFDDPLGWPGRLHDGIAAILIGLTGPFSILFAPLFLVRALYRSTRWSWFMAAVIASVAAIQLACMLRTSGSAAPAFAVVWIDGISAIGIRLAGSLFLGTTLDPSSIRALGFELALVTVAVLSMWTLRRGPERPARIFTTVALTLLVVASLYRCRESLESLQLAGYGSRYFFPPQLIVLWLLASAVGDPRGTWRWTAILMVTLTLAVNAKRLREPPLVDLRWSDYVPKLRNGEAVIIPINPSGWTMSFPARPRCP